MIELVGLTVRAGRATIGPVTLTVPAGGYALLTGPTGAGKTTLLECVAGLRPAAAGRVTLAGRDVTRLTPAGRGVGYLPQDVALFGRLTVAENIGFAPAVAGVHPAPRVAELAAELGLAHLLARRADALSGGEAQRTALARAVAHRPAVLLLDEPFTALDDKTRDQVAAAVAMWHKQDGFTALHVTHHPADTAGLATARFTMADVTVSTTKSPPT